MVESTQAERKVGGSATILIGAGADEGDIFHFKVLGRYYFLQIVAIREIENVYPNTVYIYLMVVFEKSFSTLPESIDDLDLHRIYRIKYKPKNSLLYIMPMNFERQVTITKSSSAGFEKYRDIELHPFGRADPVSEFTPAIVIPDRFLPVQAIDNAEGIDITPSAAEFTYVYDRIEQDSRHKTEKLASFVPHYFKTWPNEVEPDPLLKMEKIFAGLDAETDEKAFLKHLKSAVSKINKLEEKTPFIYTIEAEDIWNALQKMAERHQVPAEAVAAIVEKGREW